MSAGKYKETGLPDILVTLAEKFFKGLIIITHKKNNLVEYSGLPDLIWYNLPQPFKFGKQGEKTGWTYIEIPADLAQKLKPGNKKEFKVKGKLDKYVITRVSLLPMGSGIFIMALNAEMRKAIGKDMVPCSRFNYRKIKANLF